MASIHPSRLGLVPQAPSPRRRSPTPPTSREEELKRRLLEKRKQKETSENRDGASASASPGPGPGGEGGFKIKGSSSHQSRREEASGRRGSVSPDRKHDRYGSRRSPSPRRERRYTRSPSPPRPSRRNDEYRPRERSTSRDRDRDRRDRRKDERERDEPPPPRDRRASPSYDARPPGPPMNPAREAQLRLYGYSDRRDDLPRGPPPPRDMPPHDNGYGARGERNGYGGPPGPPPPPMRMGFDRPGGYNNQGGYGYGGGKHDFERRRLDRENNPLSIWPPSPKRPYREEDDLDTGKSKRKSKKSKSKRRRRYSDESDSTDSEDERERRKRRERKREKARRRDEYSDEAEEEERRRDRKGKSRRRYDSEEDRDRERHRPSRSRSVVSPVKESDWIEKGKSKADAATADAAAHAAGADVAESDDDGEMVGPQLPAEHKERAIKHGFHNMLPGEAAAMAAYASSGQRIPRRGEIGLDAQKIEEFEASGFVMSGSRHKRMNAVRMRKENQVISAEEKRAILNLQKEERMKKEGAIISQFKELLDDNWRSQGLKDGQHE